MYAARIVEVGRFAHVDPVSVGGGRPVVIQTMWKDRLSFSDLEGEAGRGLVERIGRLGAMGCGLLRFAVPDMESAEILGRLAGTVSMPLVADIHFDYKIALRCLDFPVSKIRINPGNISGREKVEAVLGKAAAKKTPIRIGVNAGSLPRDLKKRVDEGFGLAEALVLAAERELAVFEDFGFLDVLVSLKTSSVGETVRANRLFASQDRTPCPPLHVGVTEAGPLIAGTVRNAAALLGLLTEGIGDTIRVSLSDTMEIEVIAAREILHAAAELAATAGERPGAKGEGPGANGGGTVHNGAASAGRPGRPGVTIISCPRCGRNSFDTLSFSARWLPRLYTLDRDLTVAIMGCVVNGPGEARHADLGITGAGNKVLLFRQGKVIRTIDAGEADAAFEEELEKL
jgi:(E)-4-hydroxy-3-methylbut-2-enyl-diphosphate synthase